MSNKVDKMIDEICEQFAFLAGYAKGNSTRFEHCTVGNVYSDDTADIQYENRKYRTKILNGISLSKGQTVIVCIPDNKIDKRFILGKI